MMGTVAYFCSEFGINELMPFYAGGLGLLAGDHLKAANDLGLPVIGVGLLYRQGYFQQRITLDGMQEALYPEINPADLPLTPVLNELGKPVLVEVFLKNRAVKLMAWCAMVGAVPIYFLDADIKENQPEDRCLTARLYPGEQISRLEQEILLGVGGVRLLRKLGVQPAVWHLNEGHVAFQVLERIREYSLRGLPFPAAFEAVRASTVFTTHTPVPAGHDTYNFELVDKYLGELYGQLGVGREEILALGKAGNQFNLTRLALRTSSRVNGVSKIHADVTKQLFQNWSPDILWQDISVDAITNGIHTPTWLAPEMKELFDKYLDKNWEAKVADKTVWEPIREINDRVLWNTHMRIKSRMLEHLRLPGHLAQVLVVGFARRFAAYKRAALLINDLERLDRIVNHPDRPVCLIFAGKAHPADGSGQELLRRVVETARMDRFRERIFFIENYDIENAKQLVQGVDVWLNTPVKSMEASGTSGQKAAINGVINCSVLDGWWDEGYNGANGWAITAAAGAGQAEKDRAERESLYDLLANEIAPRYYRRSRESLPREWIMMMKESICSLTPVFCTDRMVMEYQDKLYGPVADRGLKFTANNFEVAQRVADYKQLIRENWHHVQVETVEFSGLLTQSRIRLGPVWPGDVLVELVWPDGPGKIRREKLELKGLLSPGVYIYKGELPPGAASSLKSEANIRVVPVSPDFANDFELELTAWGRR